MVKRYRLRDSDWRLVNRKTGETADVNIDIHGKGGRFMKIWQGTGWEKNLGELQGNSLRVLFHLTMVASWKNRIPSPTETSKAMAIKRPNVSRAYSELIKAGFVYKTDGVYYLSPLYCWKGNEEQYEQAMREFNFTAPHRIEIEEYINKLVGC